MKAFEPDIKSLTFIPSAGGVFEVTVNGQLVFSKKKLGRHIQGDEVVKAVEAKFRPAG